MTLSNGAQKVGFDLERVMPIIRNGRRVKYVTSITARRICELLEGEQIVVDYDYQRGIKVTYGRAGSQKRTPMVDNARVEDIARKILEGRLYGGCTYLEST